MTHSLVSDVSEHVVGKVGYWAMSCKLKLNILLELLSVTGHAQMVEGRATAKGSFPPSVSLRSQSGAPHRMNVECTTHVDSSQTHKK